MLLPAFIGLRYTRAKRRNQFISFVSGFSLLGMTLGTLALIVVMSVMNGFDREIKQRLLQVIPHIEVFADDGISNWPALQQQAEQQSGVVAAAPYVSGDAMVSYERGMQGVQLRGVRPQDLDQLSGIADHMVLGDVAELQPGSYGIVIGRLLARFLGVVPGDKVTVTLPQLNVTPMGIYPRVKRFTVVGVFEVGAQVDQSLILLHISDAQKLLRLGDKVTGIEVKTADQFASLPVAAALQKQLADTSLTVRDWTATQTTLFAAVKMEKTVVTVLLMIIIAVAAFNIISSLVLMVADKRSDIAVLRTLGMTRGQVMGIFMVQGAAIGWLGVALGALIGSLLAIYIGPVVSALEALVGLQVFDPRVYFISRLPSKLLPGDVAVVVSVGLLLSLLSTLYPAYRASRIEPAEALRYD